MNLYLLRHGDALEQGYEDHHRPLSPHGKEQSRLAAATLQKLGALPDIVITSPILRAKETAMIVQQDLGLLNPVASDYMIPGADHRKLIEELDRQSKSSALLVGHEPHLSTLVSILINGNTYSHVTIKKGCMLLIETPAPIERGRCQLRWLLTQEEMQLMQK